VVDLPHALPASIRPQFTVDLRERYVARVQRPALRPPASLVPSRLGLGGRLPNPAYPVGRTGTAAQ
jgi:hypothetical protein